MNAHECITVRQLLDAICNKMRFDSRDYFFKFNDTTNNSYATIIDANTIINDEARRFKFITILWFSIAFPFVFQAI